MFFEDAHVGSRELDIALTSRTRARRASPLRDSYFAPNLHLQVAAKAYKVAVCDQVEDPKLAKGL